MTSSVNKSRVPGGKWDKLGNRYESLWIVDALLSVLRGDAISITVEPLLDEGEGVDFIKELKDGTRDHVSVKRQNTANLWSLADLTRPKGETRRSMLGDLFNRLVDRGTRATFVSQTTANTLLNVCEKAKQSTSSRLFEEGVGTSEDLRTQVERCLIQGLRLNWDELWNRLCRLTVCGVDETSFRMWLERSVEWDIISTNNCQKSPEIIRLLLYELVYAWFGKPVCRATIVTYLADRALAPRDWSGQTDDLTELERRNRLYAQGVEAELIENAAIPRNEVSTLVEEILAGTKTVVLAGSAGLGKSCVLAQFIRELDRRQIPHLAIRLDNQTGVRSAAAFGRDLGFSMSPVAVLSGIAARRNAVLVVDQLDALSTASGRNPLLWEVFRDLQFEIKQFGTIQLVLACRTYDLENDSQLRRLANDPAAKRVILQLLDVEKVRAVIAHAGGSLSAFKQSHLELLRTPLHLGVFLLGDPESAQPATDLTQLYDRYWIHKRNVAEARLPRPIRFEKTVNHLAAILSERQSLSAPRDIFDREGLGADAEALASDHVLVVDGNNFRFFHETFFDYSFARGFIASEQYLLTDLLPEGEEQHLFRRGQLRQILAYLRGRERGFLRYLSELRSILITPRVRIHLKKMVLDWLRQLPDPTIDEWAIIRELVADTELGWSARMVPWNKPAWFGPLFESGTWAVWLDGGEDELVDFAVRTLGGPEILRSHSAAIAKFIRLRLKDTPEWRRRVLILFESAEIHRSREFFDLFLETFRAGWLDTRIAHHHSWYGFSHLAAGNAEYAGEFLAEYLQRWLGDNSGEGAVSMEQFGPQDSLFFTELRRSDPVPVLRRVIPVLSKELHDRPERDKAPQVLDPLMFEGSFLSFLIDAASRVASANPEILDSITPPLESLANDSCALMLEEAWSVNGEYFAEKAVEYLVAMPCRLKVGSQSQTTRKLLRAIGGHVSPQSFQLLEEAILSYRNDWERMRPDWSGDTQYSLLQALPEDRLGPSAWHRLDELRRKFGNRQLSRLPAIGAAFVPSPIPEDAAARMTDRQWTQAMRKYKIDGSSWKNGRRLGGMEELASLLEKTARLKKNRFARLLLTLPADIPGVYFEHLFLGIAKTEAKTQDVKLFNASPDQVEDQIDTETLEKCVMRLHSLPGSPCGKTICWSLRDFSQRNLPDSLIYLVAQYAENDPDPEKELWREKASGGGAFYSGDPQFNGMNTVRGAAAETIHAILMAHPDRWTLLERPVRSLVRDKSLAVRSCALGCLLARVRENRDEAVGLFQEMIVGADSILGTLYMDYFLHEAAYSHYSAIRSLIQAMLTNPSEKAREIAAKQITVAAFSHQDAHADLENHVLTGDEHCRIAAAGVFARNLGSPEVADNCREQLRRLFNDPSAKVREQAGYAWRSLNSEQLVREKSLIEEFIDSLAFRDGVDTLQNAMNECAERLPEIVLRIPERLLEERHNPGDGRIGFAVASAGELVMRLYQQSRANRQKATTPAFEKRCLDVIDAMLILNHGHMESELRKLDE